ncbi:hypothetical protein A5636_21465 [Mycobacterium asiaticum]|uniref:PirG n=2 Tax=Mycobacterium asiaticum TaxID=1790 RepID=A0A1A3NB25_MYCAS|nr:hypothetical protein A5636_21465 [Mycobacterium asiaticum]
MSAVAALAVASPCAYFLVYESTADTKPVEHHEFKRAASVADLPNELIGALSQGLSQFGVNLPPVPALGGGGASTGLGTSPGLASPGLGGAGLTSPGLTSPGLTSPSLASPGLTSPGLASPGLAPSTPGSLALPGTTLTPPTAATGTGVNPALTSPTGVAPGLTSPSALSPATGTGEVPISAPVGLDPGVDGTYPILGDTSGLGGGGGGLAPLSPVATGGGGGGGGGGGLVNDLMQAANQLGASQAIDLLKGLVMPAIMQGVQGGAAGAPAGATPALPGVPAVPGAPALPAALPGAAAAAGLPAAPAVPSVPGVPAAAAIPAAAAAPAAPVAVPAAITPEAPPV